MVKSEMEYDTGFAAIVDIHKASQPAAFVAHERIYVNGLSGCAT